MNEIRNKAREIFEQAVEILDQNEREKLVSDHCSKDAELKEEVDRLLQANEEATGLFRSDDGDDKSDFELQPSNPSCNDGDSTQSLGSSTLEKEGQVIAGRYKLRQNIGEGGMGSVWVAEQLEPVKRKVAVKMVKAGMDSKQVLARFNAERQALALMDHPNIAKVFDGGMTDQGRPFFVMEYVKGIPFTRYCDEARVPLKQRLELFIPVCQAIQHAHQKGIVHRDLKPSNILICLYDGRPVPKVIDFGLAKALHQPLTDQSIFTAHGMMVGTPIYMSPEQAELNNLDVDTRTDIYSLGVMLYELLVGSTPLEKAQFKEAAFNEVLRIIKEVEPPRPSTRLSGSTSLPSIAAQRNIDPKQLCKSMSGDLDWIVMKSLEKERTRRYETATELTRDIERFLNDEPVEACPPSTSYRLSKFVRKNRSQVVAASLLFATLLLGIVGTSWGFWNAKIAETNSRKALVDVTTERNEKIKLLAKERAQRELLEKRDAELVEKNTELNKLVAQADLARNDANEIAYFLRSTLSNDRPESEGGLGEGITIEVAVLDAEKKIESLQGDNNYLRTKLWLFFGDYWHANGSSKNADRCFENAVKTEWEAMGAELTDDYREKISNVRMMMSLGLNGEKSGRITGQGNSLLFDDAIREERLTPERAEYLEKLRGGKARLVELVERYYAANTLLQTKDFESSSKEFETLLDEIRKEFGSRSRSCLKLLSKLIEANEKSGKLERAFEFSLQAVEVARELYGLAAMESLDGEFTNIRIGVELEKFDQILPSVNFLAKTIETKYASANPDVFGALGFLIGVKYLEIDQSLLAAEYVLNLSKNDDAKQAFSANESAAEMLETIGMNNWKLDRYEVAAKIYEWAYEVRKSQRGETDRLTLIALANIGVNRFENNELEKAKEALEKVVDQFDEKNDLAWIYSPLMEIYAKQGKRTEAMGIAPGLLTALKTEFREDKIQLAAQLINVGDILCDLKAYQAALQFAVLSVELREEVQPEKWTTFNARVHLGRCLVGQGQLEKAKPLLESGYAGLLARFDSIPEAVRQERVLRPIDLLLSVAAKSKDTNAKEKWTRKRNDVVARFKEN